MAYPAYGAHVWSLYAFIWFLLKVSTKHLAVLPVLYLAICSATLQEKPSTAVTFPPRRHSAEEEGEERTN